MSFCLVRFINSGLLSREIMCRELLPCEINVYKELLSGETIICRELFVLHTVQGQSRSVHLTTYTFSHFLWNA